MQEEKENPGSLVFVKETEIAFDTPSAKDGFSGEIVLVLPRFLQHRRGQLILQTDKGIMRKKARGSISHKSKCKCPYQMFSKSKSLICKTDYIFWPSGVYLETMRSALENESMKFTKVTDYRRKAVCVCVCVCVCARA